MDYVQFYAKSVEKIDNFEDENEVYSVVEFALSLETQRSQKLVFNLSQFWTPSIICMLIFVDMKSGGTQSMLA